MAKSKAIAMGRLGEFLEVKLLKNNRFIVYLSEDDGVSSMIIDKDNFYKFIDQIHKIRSDQK